MQSKGQLILAFVVVSVIVVAAITVVYYGSESPPVTTQDNSCDSIVSKGLSYLTSGYTYVCGIGSALDGRLNITVHNYRFDQAKNIGFEPNPYEQLPLPDTVILLVNVTVENIGGGNATMGAGFQAAVLNGTSYAGATQTIANVSLPNLSPNQAIPDYLGRCGCIYLPPEGRANLWLLFYISFTSLTNSSIAQASAFKLQFLTYWEHGYGGSYLGYGAFSCRTTPCQDLRVEFIIAP